MDITPSFHPLWSLLSWLIPFIFVVSLLQSPTGKGHLGEWLVRLLAYFQLDKNTYRRLHNVTLSSPDGTTQIDHVFISTFGVFVLETKNMRGWIFGNERQAQWTQKLYKHSFKFQNPLRQNYKHLKALEALGIAPEHLHSVISFIGGASFKTPMPANVTQGSGFIHYIKSFQRAVYSESEVEALLHILQTGRHAPTLTTHRQHVQNLQRRSDPSAERQCPKCGNALVIRTVKSGAKAGQRFWGCSTFPNCRVIQKLR